MVECQGEWRNRNQRDQWLLGSWVLSARIKGAAMEMMKKDGYETISRKKMYRAVTSWI